MPIEHLKIAEHKNVPPSPVERIQQTLKKPFSPKALILSLAIGLGVTVLVTVILTVVQLFSNRVEQPVENNSEAVVEEVTEIEDVTKNADTQTVVPGEIFIDVSKIDTDGDGIYDWAEVDYGTDPLKADTDFDGFDDRAEVLNGFDPTGFGRPDLSISIEKLSLDAPITYPESTEENDIQAAMAKGVAYYPGTAFPGRPGNTYLTGHSSDYAWNPGEYKRVFRQLNDVEIGDRVSIHVKYNSGYEVEYVYEVYDKQVMAIDASELWQADRDGAVLTLVTSWPIDSTRERLMVRAALVLE